MDGWIEQLRHGVSSVLTVVNVPPPCVGPSLTRSLTFLDSRLACWVDHFYMSKVVGSKCVSYGPVDT